MEWKLGSSAGWRDSLAREVREKRRREVVGDAGNFIELWAGREDVRAHWVWCTGEGLAALRRAFIVGKNRSEKSWRE